LQLQTLIEFQKSHAAIRLLRANSGPFIIAFLHQQFKQTNRSTVKEEHLLVLSQSLIDGYSR